jgi:NAD-dependent SIR2 family protein deacetylase
MILSNERQTAQINTLKTAIGESELIIIGAGSGFSASAGLYYGESLVFNTMFPVYTEHYGLQTINEAAFFNFPTQEEQYAFWVRFVSAIRYNFPAGKPYMDLHKIVWGKNYFILTTNYDGQFHK